MAFKVGDYVKFLHDGHDQMGRREYIGRVEKNPAEGLISGRFVPIPDLISVIYSSHPHGANERVLCKESELTLVMACPHQPKTD